MALCMLSMGLISRADDGGKAWAIVRFAQANASVDISVESSGRQGYCVPSQIHDELTVQLQPLREGATLEEEGVELLDIASGLAAVGVTPASLDLHLQAHRAAIGSALLSAVEKHYGMRAIHLADTSRVSGGARYGDATVRDTASPTLRGSHHSFHMDKNFESVSRLFGGNASEAVERTIDNFHALWLPDWARLGVSREAAAAAMLDDGGQMINCWVALTPGGVVQEPMAFIDRRSLQAGRSTVITAPVSFPGLLEDTISIIRAPAAENATFLWRPAMRFGEVAVFRTVDTPHSAVRVTGMPSVPRQSAEMRMLLLHESRD